MLLAIAVLLAVPNAVVDDSLYCRKVEARAREDAALLVWPKLVAEGVRFPAAGTAQIGPTVGGGFQPRIGLSYAPLEAYRGSGLSRLARADCAAHAAAAEVRELVAGATNRATLRALEAEVAFFEAQGPKWQELRVAAERRLSSGLITLLELQELRRRISALERQAQAARSERDRLASAPLPDVASFDAAAGALAARSMDWEREAARVRGFDRLQLKLTGGVIPAGSTDWYALVELSFNLGSLFRGRATDDYLEARREELARGKDDLLERLTEVRNGLAAQRSAAQGRLALVDQELSSLRSVRDALANARAVANQQVLAVLSAEELLAEADRTFLDTLVASLSNVAEEHRATEAKR